MLVQTSLLDKHIYCASELPCHRVERVGEITWHSLLQLLSGKRRKASMPYRSMFTNPASGATIGTRAAGGGTSSPSLLSSKSPPTNFSDSA